MAAKTAITMPHGIADLGAKGIGIGQTKCNAKPATIAVR
jgi:hypothetical protein